MLSPFSVQQEGRERNLQPSNNLPVTPKPTLNPEVFKGSWDLLSRLKSGYHTYTCDPKPYKIVGYDPLIRGRTLKTVGFLDSQLLGAPPSPLQAQMLSTRRFMQNLTRR